MNITITIISFITRCQPYSNTNLRILCDCSASNVKKPLTSLMSEFTFIGNVTASYYTISIIIWSVQ
jgi:hypothetical protein